MDPNMQMLPPDVHNALTKIPVIDSITHFLDRYPEYHILGMLVLLVIAVIVAIGFAVRAHQLSKASKILMEKDVKLSKLYEELQIMDAAKSQFLSVAAHQLRTPLSAVKWTLKLVSDGDLGVVTDSQKEYMKSAFETNEGMIKLVDDLLNVSRIEGGGFEYVFKDCNLVDIINQVVSSFNVVAQNKNVKLVFQKPEAVSGVLKFDPDKIKMVIENLVSNAINYTPTGGQVSISLTDAGDNLKISVADTGIGIPQKVKEQIFTKFFRLQSAIKMVPNGTGLGLFISRSIVLRHGGAIELQSEEGQGSVFSFTLPKKGPMENTLGGVPELKSFMGK